MKENSQNLLLFFTEIEKFKTILRHSWTSNNKRQESSAEHSWLMILIAMSLFRFLNVKVNQLRVLKMIALHDLAEVIVSDIPAFEKSERKKNKKILETKAMHILLSKLPVDLRTEFMVLWEEYEEKKTIEAQFVQAVDKIEVIIQHNISDIATWDQGDFDIHAFYRYDLFEFDPFMKELRGIVELMSVKKIVESKNTHRIHKENAVKYHKIYKSLNNKII